MKSESKGLYTVAVARDFIARHFLFGGDWGPENQPHAHHYKVELQLHGTELDRHGYMVDIVEIEAAMDALTTYFRDNLLNDLPEFAGLNPSIENLSRIFCHGVEKRITASNVTALTVKVWENDIAWAAYREELH